MQAPDIYLFLGWLAAKKILTLDYDPRREIYFDRGTGLTISEIADEYIRETTPKDAPTITATGEIVEPTTEEKKRVSEE